jgi:hypothetical protein
MPAPLENGVPKNVNHILINSLSTHDTNFSFHLWLMVWYLILDCNTIDPSNEWNERNLSSWPQHGIIGPHKHLSQKHFEIMISKITFSKEQKALYKQKFKVLVSLTPFIFLTLPYAIIYKHFMFLNICYIYFLCYFLLCI